MGGGWFGFGYAVPVFARGIQRLAPAVAFVGRIAAKPVTRVLGLVVIVGGYAALHLSLAGSWSEHRNTNMESSDQANNMRLAVIAGERAQWDPSKGIRGNIRDSLPHFTDGVVGPLWPWVASGFSAAGEVALPAEPIPGQTVIHDEASERFFESGKRWNIRFGVLTLCLTAVWLALARRWRLASVAVFLLFVGLASWIPRGGWFQPEPLYFVLFFLTWVVAMELLRSNPLWLYCVLGLVSGLAYLAKASVHPLLGVYLIASLIRLAGGFFSAPTADGSDGGRSAWKPSNHFIGLAFLLVCHLFVVSPRLSYSHERFGSATHSYPSYWMWMNDFEEAWFFMAAHSTREALESLPPESRPSARNYLANHPPEAVWQRMADGAWRQATWLFGSDITPRDRDGAPRRPWRSLVERPGRGFAVLVLIAALGGAAVLLRKQHPGAAMRLEPERGMLCLFVISATFAYLMLHGWYTPIGDGDRFMAALVAPLVFSLLAAAEHCARAVHMAGGKRGVRLLKIQHALLWALVIWFLLRVREIHHHPFFA